MDEASDMILTETSQVEEQALHEFCPRQRGQVIMTDTGVDAGAGWQEWGFSDSVWEDKKAL